MPNRRFRHYGRRQSDVWRSATGWFCHCLLAIMATFWLALFAGIGIAEITHRICMKNASHSKVCEAVKDGLISE